MKKIFALLTWADKLLILGLIMATGFSYTWVRVMQTEGNYVIIRVSNKEIARYPLARDYESIKIAGVSGTARLEIKDGRIRMIEAPCPNKICLGMGWINKSGELIACVPNQVVVSVAGATAGEELDGISR